jgi:hypothetical protein
MDDVPIGFLMAFLLPFHVAGGAALGAALRRSVQGGFAFSNLRTNGLLLVWGAMFGGIPLLFGVAIEPSWFFLLQLGLFFGTIAVVAVCYEWLRDLYAQPGMFVATFGFVFFVVGAAVSTIWLGGGETTSLLLGLLFGGLGGLLTLLGIWMLWRGR